MKNVSLRIAAVAVALAAAAPAAATNGMRMIGFGPVQDSMGGASAAAPLDATIIVTNPAGLSALDERVDLSGTAFAPNVKYSASGAASGSSLGSDRPIDFIPTLGAVYRTTEKLTVGVAALGTAGMGVDYAADLYGSSTMTSYLNMRVAPAVAYRVTDRLSVGVAANLMYAQMKYGVADAMGMQPRDTAGSFGYGATVGLTFKAPENVTLGLAYETKSEFQDFEFDIAAHQLLVGFDGGGAPIFAPIPGGTEKLAFDQPDVATLGAAFHPVAPLLVAVDLQWIRWSTTNGKDLPQFETDPMLTGAQTWNMNWSDQIVFKVGAQLELSKELRVRAGYNYGSNPLSSDRAFENIAFPAVATHHFTVGAGYSLGSITVNAAAVYAPETSISGSNAQQKIAAYETSVSQLAFDLGASWKF